MQQGPAWITGAASGIGRQLAVELTKRGERVAGIDLAVEGLQSLERELPAGSFAWAKADVTEPASLAEAGPKLESAFGPPDLLVASAGVGYETSALRYDSTAIARLISINLIGVSNSIGMVLPGMIERRRGHIVGLSSVASFVGLPRMLAYSASKSGLNALMEAIRIETRGKGVHVTTVCPGWIRTPMTAPLRGRLDGILDVDDAARRILRAIDRKTPFAAFPMSTVFRLRLLDWLPRSLKEKLVHSMAHRVEGPPSPRPDKPTS